MRIIGRSLNILDYAISLLLRQRLKNFSIIFVFSAVIFLLASFQLTTSALRNSAEILLTAVPDITVQMMSAGRQVPLKKSAQEEVQGIFGISEIRQRVWGYYFDEKNGANYTAIGLHPEDVAASVQQSLAWGRLPQQHGEVIVAGPVSESMQLGERKQFSLFRPDLTMQSFTKVAEFAQGNGLIADDVVFMSLDDARELFGMADDEITDLLIEVGNKAEIDTVAKKISEILAGTRVITKKQIQKTYDVVFSWRSGFGSVCLLTSLFAFIILAWDRAAGLSPEERKEMGILKVTGWQTIDILHLRFWESSIIAFLSFLIGYSLAWWHVTIFDAVLLKPVLLGWSVLQPTYNFAPPFSLADMLVIASLSVIPYLVATIIPAWKSAMVRPDSVI